MFPVQISAIGGFSRWVNLAQIRELEYWQSDSDPAQSYCEVIWQTGDRERYNGALALALYDRWVEASCKIAERFAEIESTAPPDELNPPDERC